MACVYERSVTQMRAEYIFPTALIVLNIGAAVLCAVNRDYQKAIYWIAAAVLNACVTF